MKTIKQVLNSKGRAVWAVGPDESVYSAIEKMSDKGIGALVVMDGPRLVGIVSERDYARKVILKGRASKETLISEIMTEEVVTATESMTVEEGMALMTERRIRHLPIVEGDSVVGMISIGDLVKCRLKDQEMLIEQLENYITR